MEQSGQPGSPAQVGPPGQPGPVGCSGGFHPDALRQTPKEWWADYRASMLRLERWQALRRTLLVPTPEFVALAFQVGCDDQRVSDQAAWAREMLTDQGWEFP